VKRKCRQNAVSHPYPYNDITMRTFTCDETASVLHRAHLLDALLPGAIIDGLLNAVNLFASLLHGATLFDSHFCGVDLMTLI